MADLPIADRHQVLPLALDVREAAHALRVSERTLRTLVARGQVPHVRLGRRVVFPVDSLREYLSEKAARE